eukprot:5775917-Prymnesium_polylepis.1
MGGGVSQSPTGHGAAAHGQRRARAFDAGALARGGVRALGVRLGTPGQCAGFRVKWLGPGM